MSSIYQPNLPDKYQYAISPPTLRETQVDFDPEPVRELVDPLEAFASLPADSLLFGLASDGLPLLLNLHDPQPGPILLLGDQGCGKTDFLKTLILSTQRLMPPGAIQFTVLTNFPEEWERLSAPDHLLGVWPVDHPMASDLLYQLACRVQSPADNQPTLLLFDGLESILQFGAADQSYLAHLLMRGPQTLIWPVVSINADEALELPYWLAFFRTRIFGQIANQRIAQELTSIPGAPLKNLSAPSQFCLREKSHWLKFWRPSLYV